MRTKDSRRWDVMNREMLEGREGHHVQLGADARGRFHGEIIGLADLSGKCLTAKPMSNCDPQNGREQGRFVCTDVDSAQDKLVVSNGLVFVVHGIGVRNVESSVWDLKVFGFSARFEDHDFAVEWSRKLDFRVKTLGALPNHDH